MMSLIVLVGGISIVQAAHDRFQEWQPTYASKFTAILRDNCSTEYAAYLNTPAHLSDDRSCQITVSCLLSNTDERTKAVLSSANVLLGLIPVILTLMGPSSAECALLALRRPVLALLLAVGSPSKNPIRTIEYRGPVEEIVKEKRGKLKLHQTLSRPANTCIAFAEMILALGSMVNVIHLCWSIGKTTVFNPWCDRSFGPLVWTSISAVIFMLGTGTFSLVVHEHLESEEGTSYMRRFWKRLRNERVPCMAQEPRWLSWKDESYAFVFLGWMTTLLTIVHIIFGTFWFSSVLFLSAGDALAITGRFMVSAVVCRAVLMYELAGMRDTTSFLEGAMEMAKSDGEHKISNRQLSKSSL